VREYRSPDGERRLWFDPGEIERIVEDELRKASLMPTVSNPVTDLERFVEVHLQCPLDQYRKLPADVLGVTEFVRGRQPAVSINQDLTGSAIDEDETPPGLRGRWRATVAHEASHVVLHRTLFKFPENQGEMFPVADREQQLLRCLKRDVAYGRGGSDWREVQANTGMAAMLMPAQVFRRVVRSELNDLGVSGGGLTPDEPAVLALTRRLAGLLQVSRQAALIRLKTTGFLPDPTARPLGSL
jgi:hypothetical protein